MTLSLGLPGLHASAVLDVLLAPKGLDAFQVQLCPERAQVWKRWHCVDCSASPASTLGLARGSLWKRTRCLAPKARRKPCYSSGVRLGGDRRPGPPSQEPPNLKWEALQFQPEGLGAWACVAGALRQRLSRGAFKSSGYFHPAGWLCIASQAREACLPYQRPEPRSPR